MRTSKLVVSILFSVKYESGSKLVVSVTGVCIESGSKQGGFCDRCCM